MHHHLVSESDLACILIGEAKKEASRQTQCDIWRGRTWMSYVCLLSITSLACVAAFGVQGGLDFKRLMMLLSYESGSSKALGRVTYCEILDDIHVQQRGSLKTLEGLEEPTRSWLRVHFVLFPALYSILRHLRLHIFRSVALANRSCLEHPQLTHSNPSLIFTENAPNH